MRAVLAGLLLLFALPALAQGETRIGPLLEIRGNIDGDATLAGMAIAVEAEITGVLSAAGYQIGIGAATKVGRNTYLIGHTLAVAGELGRHAWIAGVDVTADPRVRGDLKIASAGAVRIGPNTRVEGSLTVWSPEPPEIHPSARIAGDVAHNPGGLEKLLEDLIGRIALILQLAAWGLFLATGFGLAVFAPGFTRSSAGSIRSTPLDVAAWGAGTMFGVPIVAVIAAFTLVGLPLAVTLILALLIFAALGYLIAAAALGIEALRLIRVDPARAVFWGMVAMAIGLAGLFAAGHIPVLGSAIAFAAYLLGLGAFARELFRRMR